MAYTNLRHIIPFVAAILVSCSVDPLVTEENKETESSPLYFTKSGSPDDGVNRTFRASNMYNGDDAVLLADGAYCNILDEDKGWLLPCKVDDDGNALDAGDSLIAFDDAEWATKTVHDTEFGLRTRARNQEDYAALVVCSPARRMKKYYFGDENGGTEVPYGTTVPKEKTVHWGYKLDCGDEFYISESLVGTPLRYSVFNGAYIYDEPIVLNDKRARINVVVACGALDGAYLNKLHFQNSMTSVWYQPKHMVYEYPEMDYGYADPLEAYTVNSYPGAGEDVTGNGNVFLAPEGDDLHLLKRSDPLDPYTEWSKAAGIGTAVTAIREFPIFALNYAERDPSNPDVCRYETLIPKIVVYSGIGGALKTTVRIEADIRPMKEYTVLVRLSTAVVSAELFVSEWYQGCGEAPLDVFGYPVTVLPSAAFNVDSWIDNPPIDESEGKIGD